MSPTTETFFTKLKADLVHTQVKLYQADSSPEYKALEQCWIEQGTHAAGIARPQTAEDVAAVVQACIKHDVAFTVRSGRHGWLSLSPDTLMIDMRDIAQVTISADKQSAKIGGGILCGEVAKSLGEDGLATPTATSASVGFVGWATLGGYGPLTTKYGMGVEQILLATIVDAQGQLGTASDDLLQGIRGGGGSLGIIVELTVKTYPINKALYSVITYESSNLEAALTTYTKFYEHLVAAKELPSCLQLEPSITRLPGQAATLLVKATWHGDDMDEGHAWMTKIATGGGHCVLQNTQELSIAEILEHNEKVSPWPVFGRIVTVSVAKLSAESIAVIAAHCADAPGSGQLLCYQTLGEVQESKLKTTFGTQTRHHMLKIFGMDPDSEVGKERLQWAMRLKASLLAEGGDEVLESSYISMSTDEDSLEKIYGSQNLGTLLRLKRRYDPDNVFNHTIPGLKPWEGM